MRSLLKNFLLSIGSILFVLLIAEIGFASFYAYLQKTYPKERQKEDILWEYDALLGWEKRASAEAEFIGHRDRIRTPVKTNAKGLRGKEYDYEKEKDVKRILLLGDSIIAGLEVKEEELISTRLAEELHLSNAVEIINGGVRGYGTDQSYLFFKEEGIRYQPDLVIYFFVNNDLRNNIEYHRPWRKYGKPCFILDDQKKLQLTGVPVPQNFKPNNRWKMTIQAAENEFNEKLKLNIKNKQELKKTALYQTNALLSKSAFYSWVILRLQNNKTLRARFPWLRSLGRNANYLAYGIKASEHIEKQQWEITEALIIAMSELAQSKGSEFIVFDTNLANTKYAKHLQEFCPRNNIRYVQLNKSSLGIQDRVSFKHDAHWTPRGHQVAAKNIANYIRKNKLLEN